MKECKLHGKLKHTIFRHWPLFQDFTLAALTHKRKQQNTEAGISKSRSETTICVKNIWESAVRDGTAWTSPRRTLRPPGLRAQAPQEGWSEACSAAASVLCVSKLVPGGRRWEAGCCPGSLSDGFLFWCFLFSNKTKPVFCQSLPLPWMLKEWILQTPTGLLGDPTHNTPLRSSELLS